MNNRQREIFKEMLSKKELSNNNNNYNENLKKISATLIQSIGRTKMRKNIKKIS